MTKSNLRQKIKSIAKEIMKKPPGERFWFAHVRINQAINHNAWLKGLFLGLGCCLCLVGFILLFIPGPGIPLLIVGLALLCIVSKKVAKISDRIEHKIHAWHKKIKKQ